MADENTNPDFLSLLRVERIRPAGGSRNNRPRKVQLRVAMPDQRSRSGSGRGGPECFPARRRSKRRSCCQSFGKVDNHFAGYDETGFLFVTH